MPRFFFHSQDEFYLRDDIGAELPNVAAARAEATKRAIILFTARDAKAWFERDWMQIVTDESGTVVLRLGLKRAGSPRSN